MCLSRQMAYTRGYTKRHAPSSRERGSPESPTGSSDRGTENREQTYDIAPKSCRCQRIIPVVSPQAGARAAVSSASIVHVKQWDQENTVSIPHMTLTLLVPCCFYLLICCCRGPALITGLRLLAKNAVTCMAFFLWLRAVCGPVRCWVWQLTRHGSRPPSSTVPHSPRVRGSRWS